LSADLPLFSGFYKETFKFFTSLEKNNNSKWFATNREPYQNFLVTPAKSFVSSIAEFFNQLNPAIRTEPKFNKTLMRISKDMRFAKGDPYKNYFLIHFGRFKMDSEFYVYLDKNGIEYGLFINATDGEGLFFNQNLKTFRKEIINVFSRFKLNNKFELDKMDKMPELVLKKFDANKHFEKLDGIKYILFQTDRSKNEKIIYSANFLTETIKIFSRLYPLYCFAISPEPLKLLDEFEERLGVAN
jgi:uncharacterized protein (TIGR02453 family)